MDFLGTKDHGEREDEEAERLVRPLPKKKPPRKDRRREEMQTDRDPDTDGDTDLKNDPDMSLNYKNVGGSLVLVRRVVARFKRAESGPKKYVSVSDSEQGGKVVSVPEQTAKNNPSRYKPVKDKERSERESPGAKKPEGPKEESKGEESKGEESKGEESKGEEPKGEEPKAEEPKAEEPKAEEPKAEEPKAPEEKKAPDSSSEEQMAARVRERFKAKNYQNHPEFKEYTQNLPTTDDSGNFYDPKSKKRVPWDQLDPNEQSRLINDFATKKKRKSLDSKLDALDPKVKAAIQSLADPKSELSKKLDQYKKDGHPIEGIPPEKLIPALKGLNLPAKSIADLQGAASDLTKRETTKAEQEKAQAAEKNQKELEEAARKAQSAKDFKPPNRKPPTEEERLEVLNALWDMDPPLPSEIQVRLGSLHPEDAKLALSSYTKFNALDPPKNLKREIQEAGRNYVSDPLEVTSLPKYGVVKVQEDGKEVEKKLTFDKLTPGQKQQAVHEHRMKLLGASLASRSRVAKALVGNGIPKHLSTSLAHATLSAGSLSESERKKKVKTWATNLFTQSSSGYGKQEESDGRFGHVVRTTTRPTLSDKDRTKFIEAIKKLDPVGQQVAVAALQGEDYREAKARFLDPKSGDAIRPTDDPEDVARKLSQAQDMMSKAGKRYPSELSVIDPATILKVQTLKKLRDQDPAKARQVVTHIREDEVKRYHAKRSEWESKDKEHKTKQKAAQKEHDAWEKRKTKHEAKYAKDPYRAPPFDEPEPELLPDLEPPRPPIGYLRKLSEKDREKAKLDLKQLRRASLYSSYGLQKWQMGTTPPSNRDRTALYHGVEPYPKGHEGFAPYTKWNQPHRCDLGASDFDAILKSAKEWLKSPVLAKDIEGMVPDARFRAALDLAIHASRYNRAISPPLYNMMLAKLASQPADETLLTVHAATDRVAFSTEETEGNAMTVKFAKDQANAILGRLDKAAGFIQENYKKFGMDFDTAKAIVNDLDKTADEIEAAAFGEASLLKRQTEVLAASNPKLAKVLQQDSDEKYMGTFNAPMAPHQTDADEKYMGQFKDDQSEAVHEGKSTTGKPLAP